MIQMDASSVPSSVGFIGLGLMGKPMVVNLAKKLPPGSRIHVHDVVAAAVDELCSSYPDTVVRCTSAKDVTEKSVRMSRQEDNLEKGRNRAGGVNIPSNIPTGCHPHYAARR